MPKTVESTFVLPTSDLKDNSLATEIPVLQQSSTNNVNIESDVTNDCEPTGSMSSVAVKESRKVFNLGLDPVYFFNVALVCVLVLLVGLATLYLKNDRIMRQHLSQLSVDSAALEARMAASVTLLSSSTKETVAFPVVLEPEDIKQQAVEIASVDNLDSAIDQPVSNLEVDQLKAMLAKQEEQIELLAAENHELRLAAEFNTQSYSTVKPIDITRAVHAPEQIQPSRDLSVVNEFPEQVTVNTLNNDNIDDLISKGFSAYNKQDYTSAQQWYDSALHLDPHNRDANLGVAAVASKQGNYRLAENRYRHLLSLNIDDLAAFSALLSFSTPANSTDVELRELIDQRSSNPSELYAVLGSYYSQQGLWSRASVVYLKSVALASKKNPDHYYNLAVSLDNQSLYADAARYYHQALAIAAVSSFDRAMVMARLETLENVP